MFKITEYKIESNNDLIIAHFSDLHYERNFDNRKLEIIVSKMKELKPDYICITGDIIDNLSITEKIEMININIFFDELVKIAKVLVVLGNHDIRDYKNMKDNKWYNRINKEVIVLNNSSYEDKNIYFYGLSFKNNYYLDEKNNIDVLYNELVKIDLREKKYNILLFKFEILQNIILN